MQTDSKNIKLVYIMSPSYSGSTLLTTLLAQRTNIATIGELKANNMPDINTYSCSCGTPILECAFWKQLQDHIGQQGGHLELSDFATRFRASGKALDRVLRPNVKGKMLELLRHMALNLVPSFRSDFQKILEQNRHIITAACKIYNTNTFLDGSKDPLRALIFSRYTNYDLKVIYLTRDGRGTLNSDKKYNGLSTREAAVSWKNKIEEMDRVAAMLPKEQLFKLRYETLCETPEETFQAIVRFAQLDELPEQDARNELHILGNNNMRLVKTSEIRLDEKWKKSLSEADIREFQSIAGPVNQKLGYGVS